MSNLKSCLKNEIFINIFLTVQNEFIEYFDYDALEFKTTTEDGYILTNFRVRAKNFTTTSNKVAIISVGMFETTDSVSHHNEGLRELCTLNQSR